MYIFRPSYYKVLLVVIKRKQFFEFFLTWLIKQYEMNWISDKNILLDLWRQAQNTRGGSFIFVAVLNLTSDFERNTTATKARRLKEWWRFYVNHFIIIWPGLWFKYVQWCEVKRSQYCTDWKSGRRIQW